MVNNTKARNIGFGIPIPPAPEKFDLNDPFYGEVKVKKNNFTARVVSAKASKSAVVEIERKVFNKKYKRYEKRKSRFSTHNPLSINAKEGDIVRVFETRPLSKTKHHVIVQVLGQFVEIQGQDLAKEKIESANKESSKSDKPVVVEEKTEVKTKTEVEE